MLMKCIEIYSVSHPCYTRSVISQYPGYRVAVPFLQKGNDITALGHTPKNAVATFRRAVCGIGVVGFYFAYIISAVCIWWVSWFMMTSSNGHIFRVTGHLCGEFTGPRWIPCTKASDAELWCLFDLRPNILLNKHSWGCWFKTPSHPLWRHCNV